MTFLKDLKNSTATDQDLIRLYKKDADIRTLAELYQRYMDLMFAVCFKYLKNTEAAKDAVMAVFEELISKLLKHEIVHFKGWLYMVTRNYCLMQLRSQKQMPPISDSDIMQLTENLHLDNEFDKEEHLNQLEKCIETLSPEQKESVRLFYFQEKCYKEIATITQSDWSKVRSLIQNARRNLKICMDRNLESE